MDIIEKAKRKTERANAFPVGSAKRRRIVRRVLRMNAAFFRSVGSYGNARAYERAARHF